MAPFKDTFLTTTYAQDDCAEKEGEPRPILEAMVSILSTGPVGPGDAVNNTNATVVMPTCTKDGLLLKPS